MAKILAGIGSGRDVFEHAQPGVSRPPDYVIDQEFLNPFAKLPQRHSIQSQLSIPHQAPSKVFENFRKFYKVENLLRFKLSLIRLFPTFCKVLLNCLQKIHLSRASTKNLPQHVPLPHVSFFKLKNRKILNNCSKLF